MTSDDGEKIKTTRLSDHVASSVSLYFDSLSGEQPCGVYQMVMNEVERPLLEIVMQYTNNNQSKASKILGINRNTLRKKLESYDLP